MNKCIVVNTLNVESFYIMENWVEIACNDNEQFLFTTMYSEPPDNMMVILRPSMYSMEWEELRVLFIQIIKSLESVEWKEVSFDSLEQHISYRNRRRH